MDLHKSLGFDSMERAYREGMTLSRWLETEDPSDEYKDGLDAFERQLAVMDITTTSNPERGFYADEFRKFEDAGEAGRVLQIEWMARQYRKHSQKARAVLQSDDAGLGGVMRPYVDAAGFRAQQMAPAIPVAELIALRTQIDSNAYRALYLNDDESEYRMVRVGEAAEIPAAKLSSGEKPIDLFKYGRRLDISYEALRRTPIDTVAFYIARMAIQAEVDKAATIADVIVNGDGNAGTAATVYDLTDLDTNATAGTLTLKAWLAFKLKFKNPYNITHELVQSDVALQQLLLNTGSANVPLVNYQDTFGGFVPMNDVFRDNVRYGVTDDAPSGKIVALDSRFALEEVSEIGGSISESKKWIEKQVNTMTFTEVIGYAVIDSHATKILNLGA